MRLQGKLIKGTILVRDIVVEREDGSTPFHDLLEGCLIDLCRELDIQVPIWLKKNTKEFAAHRTAYFGPDQFIEKVKFDRFEIRVL